MNWPQLGHPDMRMVTMLVAGTISQPAYYPLPVRLRENARLQPAHAEFESHNPMPCLSLLCVSKRTFLHAGILHTTRVDVHSHAGSKLGMTESSVACDSLEVSLDSPVHIITSMLRIHAFVTFYMGSNVLYLVLDWCGHWGEFVGQNQDCEMSIREPSGSGPLPVCPRSPRRESNRRVKQGWAHNY